jgi:hypothetical protein
MLFVENECDRFTYEIVMKIKDWIFIQSTLFFYQVPMMRATVQILGDF